jgi:hypothetical protein
VRVDLDRALWPEGSGPRARGPQEGIPDSDGDPRGRLRARRACVAVSLGTLSKIGDALWTRWNPVELDLDSLSRRAWDGSEVRAHLAGGVNVEDRHILGTHLEAELLGPASVSTLGAGSPTSLGSQEEPKGCLDALGRSHQKTSPLWVLGLSHIDRPNVTGPVKAGAGPEP